MNMNPLQVSSVLAIMIASLAIAPSATAQTYAVHVFAKAPEGGFVDEDSKGRLDSLVDVRKALQEPKFRGLFKVVEAPDQAELLVEIAWRGQLETKETAGTITRNPWTGRVAAIRQAPVPQKNLQLVVTVGSYRKEFWALDPDESTWGGWRAQAEDVLDKIAEWARQNREPITKALASK